ncbi:MAG: energy-coupling factor transporter ATPase [Clostridiales bacterium]|nr:energy-coupling factor transporter ATPase [Clostridiales bacterium]
MIEGKNVKFSYKDDEEKTAVRAVDGVSFTVEQGETAAVLGRNGSGKSTLAKLINGLGLPEEGDIIVLGKNTKGDSLWEIRRACGMVFQNPDSQIVASIVDEDIAFGLENIGTPTEEMGGKIDRALEIVGMSEFKKHSTQNLSGGQKQKIAIAGIFAMQPKCIILDEATSMLDPQGREAVISAVFRLKEEFGISVIMITHFIEEAAQCDKVYVMNKGKLAAAGTPSEVLVKGEILEACGLEAPFYVGLGERLGISGRLWKCGEFADEVIKKYGCEKRKGRKKEKTREKGSILEIEDVYYKYDREPVLKGISFQVREGSFTSVIGHTGSGKSTLLRTLNGIYKPYRGSILFKDKEISAYKDIRFKVGIVFQNPDYQLFEETVLQDVIFGALNMGFSEEEAKQRAYKALEAVGFPIEKAEKSPFELSGGEKKRVSIAGILIMEPEVLVLDEPAAGLDPAGRREILRSVKDIQKSGITVVMVTHSMEDAAVLSDYIVVLNQGQVYAEGLPQDIFKDEAGLKSVGLGVPEIYRFKEALKERGLSLPEDCFSAEEAAEFIKGEGEA